MSIIAPFLQAKIKHDNILYKSFKILSIIRQPKFLSYKIWCEINSCDEMASLFLKYHC